MPLVSVIIPAFNRASCIANAVDSVLSQSFTDYEVIMVDDGSTDDTKAVLQPYGDRIRYIYQPNSGACSARNTGIRAAMGKWIAFLDSDDEWLPEKLAAQMRDVRANPKVVLHTTNAALISNDGQSMSLFVVTGFPRSDSPRRVIPRPLKYQIRYGIARLQCMLVRKESLVNAGLFEERASLPIYEDQDLACRLALQGPWQVNFRCLARINRHSGMDDNLSSLRTKDPVQNARYLACIYAKLADLAGLTPAEKQLVCQTLSSYEGALGMELLRAGKTKQAQRAFVQSLRHDLSSKSVLRCMLGLLPKAMAPAIARKWSVLHD